MRKKIGVGIIGFGTVGTGAIRILTENAELIRRRVGVPIELLKVATRNTARDRGLALPTGMLTTDPTEVIKHPDIEIVAELIGGYDPARRFILEAIRRGKHVVTANKALLAVHGEEIHQAAQKAGVDIGFEASVAGGIPIIKALKEGLVANRILSIYGIINGTANFILTKMTEGGRSFPEVLAEAQGAGFAEADPTFDVEGVDSTHKLAILVNMAFGTPVALQEIYTEGITGITPMDISFGKEFGYKLKLLAIAKVRDGEIEARVHPTMVPDEYPIAKVAGVYNALQIVGDAVGDMMLSGRGAGTMPTGSAVVSDIIDIARNIITGSPGRVPGLAYQHVERRPLRIKPIEEVRSLYYMRFTALDQPGVLSQISGVLGRYRISIASMIQRGRKEAGSVPVVIMTHTALERDVRSALAEIDRLSCVTEKTMAIRVEGEET